MTTYESCKQLWFDYLDGKINTVTLIEKAKELESKQMALPLKKEVVR